MAVRALTSTVVAAALLLVAGASASAHTDLVASTPEDGAVLTAPPATLSLTFSESVSADFARASVGVGGVETNLSMTQGSDERTVVAAVPQDLSAGRWKLRYRVTSVDGHPVEGTVAFEVTAAPREEAPAEIESEAPTQPPSEDPVTRDPSDHAGPADVEDGAGDSSFVLLAVVGAGALLVVGGAAAALRRRRTRGSTE